jgi:membrane-associated phospholipid phosphatase
MQSLVPPETGRLSRYAPAAALTLAAAALVAVFLVLGRQMAGDPSLSSFDQQVTDAVLSWRTPGRDIFFWGVTLLGNAVFLGTLTAAIVIALLMWGLRTRAVLVAGGIIVAQVISSLAKYAYQRPRPPEDLMLIEAPASHSFPSGHALVTLVFFVVVIFVVCRCLKRAEGRSGGRRGARPALRVVAVVVGLVLVAAIGFSRIYLGVHWASDVLAGWSLGGAWSATVFAVLLLWRRSRLARADGRPWGSRKVRMLVVIALALLVVAAYVIAAVADPLLV